MRTREMGYKDYGLDDAEGKELRAYCRRYGFEDHAILAECALKTYPPAAADIFYSLVTGLGYTNISKVRYIPVPHVDFYGHQRRTLVMFRNELVRIGKWGINGKEIAQREPEAQDKPRKAKKVTDGQIKMDI